MATILPGVITIACLYVLLKWIFPDCNLVFPELYTWFGLSVAIAIMVITQTLGICVEYLISKTYPKKVRVTDIKTLTGKEIDAAEYYNSLYSLISVFKEEDDRHGHIQRIISQYFLTLNSLVSFTIGLVSALILYFSVHCNAGFYRFLAYMIAMVLLLVITFMALRIRYNVMIICLWSVRNMLVNRR